MKRDNKRRSFTQPAGPLRMFHRFAVAALCLVDFGWGTSLDDKADPAQGSRVPKWDARGVGPLPWQGIACVDMNDEGTFIAVGTIAPPDDPNVFQVAVKPPPATSVLAKSIDRLVVLDDLNVDVKGPYDWAPMTVGRSPASGSLAQWMRLPWGAPDQVLLPGFHTPAENSLKRGGTGEEMFLTVCGMMATGSRTVLLSRWRDGGRTSHDLVREFVRELPHRAASQAWQRSVRLASSADLAWNQEPRIKDVPPDTPPITAQHPFFWGGYMLIDRGVEPVDD